MVIMYYYFDLMPSSCYLTDTLPLAAHSLSLHDALPISPRLHREHGHTCEHPSAARSGNGRAGGGAGGRRDDRDRRAARHLDRKSTRLNSSHMSISYAVFCLKKKTKLKLTLQVRAQETIQ